MVQVGVCDDEQILAERLCSALREIFAERDADAGISLFLSGEELLKKAETFNIVFLDLEMPGLDGIETGRRLRLINPDCKIVIVSGMEHRFKETFKINARRFVSKPIDRAELAEAVDEVLKKIPGKELICLYYDQHPYQVEQRLISYAEAFNGYTQIYVGSRIYRRNESLKQLQEILDPILFAPVSQSYVVNLQKAILRKDRKSVELEKQTFPVSRRLRESFWRKLTDFDLNYGVA